MPPEWSYPYLRVTTRCTNPASLAFICPDLLGRADGPMPPVRRGDVPRLRRGHESPGRAMGRGGPRRVQSLAERGAADPPGPPREGDPREPRSRGPRRRPVPVQRARGRRAPLDPDPADPGLRRVPEGPGGPDPDDDARGRRRDVPRKPAGRRRICVPLYGGRLPRPEGGGALRDPRPHAPADGPRLPLRAPGQPGERRPAAGRGPAGGVGPPRSVDPDLRAPSGALRHRRGRDRDPADRPPDGTRGPPVRGRVTSADFRSIPLRRSGRLGPAPCSPSSSARAGGHGPLPRRRVDAPRRAG